MVLTDYLVAKAVCTMSIKVLGWQPGAPNPVSTVFRQNVMTFGTHRTSDSSMGSVAD